jgi:hypothetical protein
MSAIPPPPLPEDEDEARYVWHETELALETLQSQSVDRLPRRMRPRSRVWLGSLAVLALLGLLLARRRPSRP